MRFDTGQGDGVILTRDLLIPGDRAELYRAVARGDLVRLTAGAYMDARFWSSARPDERHRCALRALAALRPDVVFGGVSAAIAWHRPLIGAAPELPEAVVAGAAGGRSNRSTRARTTSVPFEVVEVERMRVTSLARSLVDAARVSTAVRAVAMLDHALSTRAFSESWPASARVHRHELLAELHRGTHRGRARARQAIAFADGAAQSPGESWSRVLIEQLGFASPVLQQEFRDSDGLIGRVDFFWPHWRLIGEFDGEGKYQRDEFTRGRDAASIVIAEKHREDRLRALRYGVVRWGWDDLRQPSRLRRKLEDAGLPCRGRRSALGASND